MYFSLVLHTVWNSHLHNFKEPYFSLSSTCDIGLLGRSLAEDTLITMGFRSRFCISDNRSLSRDTDRNNSSIFPAVFFNLVVSLLMPEKNLYILTQSVAVP